MLFEETVIEEEIVALFWLYIVGISLYKTSVSIFFNSSLHGQTTCIL